MEKVTLLKLSQIEQPVFKTTQFKIHILNSKIDLSHPTIPSLLIFNFLMAFSS